MWTPLLLEEPRRRQDTHAERAGKGRGLSGNTDLDHACQLLHGILHALTTLWHDEIERHPPRPGSRWVCSAFQSRVCLTPLHFTEFSRGGKGFLSLA